MRWLAESGAPGCPAGLVYIGIALWLFAGWLRESEKRLAYSRSVELAQLSSASGGRDA